MRFGFVGGSYRSQSPLAGTEMSLNWYPEKVESPNSRTAWALYRTPGMNLFCTLAAGLPSTRGACTVSGRTFWVSGTHLFETSSAGIVTDYGGTGTANNNIVDDGLPALLVAGGTAGGIYPGQLLIASGGTLTAFLLASNAFTAITAPPGQVIGLDFSDGFFIALSAGNTWQISNPEDGTTWSGLAASQVSVFSDQLLSIKAENRLVWIFGATRAVAYYDSGAPIFPYDVVNGGFMEVGIFAQSSPAVVTLAQGTTICWLGGDARGGPVVYMRNGFTPQRVSDHALEYWFSQQKTLTDAVGWGMQDQGHNFYVLWFPTANATWVLDVDLGEWHQRTTRVKNFQAAHLGRCHTYNFGQHLVGDRNSGNVYSLSINSLSDNLGPGLFVPITRTRIGPTISQESNHMFFNEFQVDFETGIGPIPPLTDGNGNPRDPYAMFSFSRDYGKTWSNEREIPCGQAGKYKTRAVVRRLGSARQWTPKVSVSDPIAWSIVDAYVNPTEDAQQRLAKSYLKVT